MIEKINWRRILIGELTLKRLLISILEIYILLALFVYFRADSLIFLPPPSSYRDDKKIIKLLSKDELISAIYLPSEKAEFTIIYSHGNAEDLGLVKTWLRELNELGFNVLSYDYQGYGTSEGKPTEKNSYSDIEASYKYLVNEIKVDPQKIILYGRSVGGGASLELATKYPIGGLILESSFVSAFRIRTIVPLLPFDKFNNLKKIGQIQVPIILIHGMDDQIVPIWHSKRLLQAIPEPKQHLWVEGAEHNNLYIVGSNQIKQAILNFTKEL